MRRSTKVPTALFIVLLTVSSMGVSSFVPTRPASTAAPSDDGRWTGPFDGGIAAVNLALRADGTVLYYDGDRPHTHGDTSTEWTFFTDTIVPSRSRVLDLGTRTVSTPQGDPGPDLFCSGISVRPDGSVLTVGGTESVDWMTSADPGGPVKGTDEVFEVGLHGTPAWSDETGPGAAPDMHLRRWYPTAIELPNGSTLAVSGIKNLTDPRTNNVMLEYLEPGASSWRTLRPSLKVADGVEVPHMGGQGDTEKAVANLPMYPRLFVVPGGPLEGGVFYASDGDIWGEFGERPAEEPIWGTYQSLDPKTGTWTVLGPSALGVRHLGATVPLLLTEEGPDGLTGTSDDYAPTLLTFGGTLQRTAAATPTTELVTLDTDRPTPELAGELHRARWQPQGILLPSGEVVAVGGATLDTTVFHGQRVPWPRTAELFDPDTRTWTEAAEMETPRGYHSTAVLTPNATVLVGGQVENPVPWPQARNDDSTDGTPLDDTPANQSHIYRSSFEIYEPPYLFHAGESRPKIRTGDDGTGWSPAGAHPAHLDVGYGQRFQVNVTGLDRLDDAALIRPGTSTHGLQSDQRGIVLDARLGPQAPDGNRTLTLTAPPDGAVAPPGYYMLFINEDLGPDGTYPSQAVFVNVG